MNRIRMTLSAWLLTALCGGIVPAAMAAADTCSADMAPTLKLNRDEFGNGDRLRLQLDKVSPGCRGPWNVYLALVPQVDKPDGTRIYLPEWSRSRQPAKTNVQLKQSLVDILDVVVEDSLPPGRHRYELTLEPVDRTQTAITLTRDFQIRTQPAQAFEVVVDLAATAGKSRSLTGFLHGVSPQEQRAQISQAELRALIVDVRPAYWRLNNDYVYRTARQSGALVTIVLGDLLAQSGVQPWQISTEDTRQWQALEQRVRNIIRKVRQSGMRADYWDLWNEPDAPASWGGSVDQFLEYVRHVVPIIRAEDPSAGIVAPSTADNFLRIPAFWEKFITGLASRQIRIDAISWHEFHRPEDLPDTARLVRERIAGIPLLKGVALHVNEYGGGQNHLVPGWQLGWLYYLDRAEVDWASHACWYWPRDGGAGNVSECIRGLDGLLHPETLEPLPAYWVNYWQGNLHGDRLIIATPSPRIVALGAYDRSAGEVSMTMGRYSCGSKQKWCRFNGAEVKDDFLPARPLTLLIKNLPSVMVTAKITIARVTGEAVETPLKQPELIARNKLEVVDGVARVQLQNFRDGDVYHLAISNQNDQGTRDASP
jgi:hypothetical protein